MQHVAPNDIHLNFKQQINWMSFSQQQQQHVQQCEGRKLSQFVYTYEAHSCGFPQNITLIYKIWMSFTSTLWRTLSKPLIVNVCWANCSTEIWCGNMLIAGTIFSANASVIPLLNCAWNLNSKIFLIYF